MTELPASVAQLSDRLEKLERQNRRLRQMLLAILVVTGTGWLLAADKPNLQPITTEKLTLRDASGKTRALLEVGADGPILRFLDAKGKDLATLSTTPDAVLFQFFGGGTRLRSGLALEKDGVALVYYNRDGNLQSGRNAMLMGSGVFPSD